MEPRRGWRRCPGGVRRDDQDRDCRLPEDFLGDRPQHDAIEPGATMAAHDDQVRSNDPGLRHDFTMNVRRLDDQGLELHFAAVSRPQELGQRTHRVRADLLQRQCW